MLGPIKPPTFPVCTSLMTCGWPAKQETSYKNLHTNIILLTLMIYFDVTKHTLLLSFVFSFILVSGSFPFSFDVRNMQKNKKVFCVFVNHPTFENYFCYNSFVFSLFLHKNRKAGVELFILPQFVPNSFFKTYLIFSYSFIRFIKLKSFFVSSNAFDD